ncbi:MAG TPA: triose-phosphate isomerase, partial [Chitinophagales bacterium]|nr:triose-phosphate isomerase [Chitinophagales bacterium]
MSRKKIVAGNWKMYKTLPEAMETIGTLTHALAVQSPKENVEVWIAPPSVILPMIIHNYHNRGISFG